MRWHDDIQISMDKRMNAHTLIPTILKPGKNSIFFDDLIT